MPFKVDPRVVSGKITGRCPKCNSEFAGFFNTDSEDVEMQCSECGHVGKYFYRWPDELPAMVLRHRNNRRLLGAPFHDKKSNPDGVLEGQLDLFPTKRKRKARVADGSTQA